jgi:RimJ/RimL family protein N-acetyltransferase/SAM-dependent methyltransferase
MNPFSPLTTPRLSLRPLSPADAEVIFAYRADPEVALYQGWEPQSLDQVRAFVDEVSSVEPDTPGTWFQLGICLKESGGLIGDFGFHFPENFPHQVELGITLARAHQGKGYATEAMAAALDYCFRTLKKHRVFASVDPENRASIALLERAGFRREAHFHESLWLRGKWMDDVIYAILEKEYLSSVQPEMFSREWYNEYFRRAVSSRAHSTFCERVYGRDLCQHGMMDMAELDYLVSLLAPGAKVLEIGCSNGLVSEYIQERSGCTLLGVDYSDVAIAQAQARTGHKPGLQFQCVDLLHEPVPGGDYDVILLIDSIYFLGDFVESLSKFYEKLNQTGRLILSAFQAKREDDPEDVLEPQHTLVSQALQALNYSWSMVDFSENVRNHWLKNCRVAEELKQDFISEDNQFLYDARVAENVWFREMVEKNQLVSFLYLVNRQEAD